MRSAWASTASSRAREPIISNVYRETPHVKVEPGMVAGCAHIGIGYRGDKEVVTLIHPQQIHPHLENQDTGDYINIYGKPEIHMAIKPEIAGGICHDGRGGQHDPARRRGHARAEAHDRSARAGGADGRERLQPPRLTRCISMRRT